MSKRLLFGTGAAVATALALLLGGLLAGDPAAEARRQASPGELARAGLGLLERARETGDTSDYSRAERPLEQALAREPNNLYALHGLGSLALTRHRFREALALGRRAQRVSPTTARTYGVIGDALIELGRYGEAFRAYDRMASLKPSLAAYARVSHARELMGDVPGAVAAMELAARAAGPQKEPLAWARVQLGKLHFGSGRLDAAALQYRAALAALPGYASGLDALARLEAARGRLSRAIALQRDAAERSPQPEVVGFLGDLYRARGQTRLAREQYALVGAIERLLIANGFKTDLETALFDVDHGLRLESALARARRAQLERPSIQADDVLSWALARTGRCGEALRFSKRALRLGTLDAPTFFHRGMIERCLGRDAGARRWFRKAVATTPHFSLVWAPLARRLAA
jgi:tetratricopeptide (TPR) repeat protein